VAGWICLQGGGEFRRACREMEAELLARAPDGPVVILAGAAAPGRDHDTAASNGARWYAGLGAADVRVAPDPRAPGAEAGATRAAILAAGLLVLPGGSPVRLLTMLQGELAGAVRAAHASGAAVVGSSAGAMVLAQWTYLPERRAAAPGVGLVPGAAVLPHYSGRRDEWLRALPAELGVLGIPESTGLLLMEADDPSTGGTVLGAGKVTRLRTPEGPPPMGGGPSSNAGA